LLAVRQVLRCSVSICAGRLAEAEAEPLKGAESLVPHLPTGKKDGNAGAPEPKQIETEYRNT
jgi:hypothetical protein